MMLVKTVNSTAFLVLGTATNNANIVGNDPFGMIYGDCVVDYVVSSAPARTLTGAVGATVLAIAMHP
jgi:hypothetical protein